MDRTGLENKALTELREIAAALDLKGFQRLKKADLIDLIAGSSAASGNGGQTEAQGNDDQPRGADALIARRREAGDGHDSGRDRMRARDRDPDADESSHEDPQGQGSDDKAGQDREPSDQPERQDAGDGQDGGRSRDSGQGPKRERRRKGGRGGQQDSFEDAEVRQGVLDLLPEGYGFLRTTGYLSGPRDVYVSQSFVRRFNLRRGDLISGPIRHNKGGDKFPALGRVDTVEDRQIDNENDPTLRQRINFGDLTPLFPTERLRLETDEENNPASMRIVDMMAPIGKGQRGLIVSPPKAGKTTILKQLENAIETNNPEVHLMVLLVDERPEEVTDFERSTKGEVISSTFDRPADDHTQVAELCIERAKRLVEGGRDVVILLDSITRLGRAYNLAAPASGRILSGGIDSAALYPPKRFFGAARNIEGGGSLTIIATALVETGSKMDEVIFEEFKGTGNMELRLDRKMEQKRIFPAIDIQGSGTRREELLLEPQELETVWKLRRLLSTMDHDAGLQLLIDKLRQTKSNPQFLSLITKSNLG